MGSGVTIALSVSIGEKKRSGVCLCVVCGDVQGRELSELLFANHAIIQFPQRRATIWHVQAIKNVL